MKIFISGPMRGIPYYGFPALDAARWEVWTADCSGKIASGTAGSLAAARDCAIAAAEAEFSRRLNLERSTCNHTEKLK